MAEFTDPKITVQDVFYAGGTICFFGHLILSSLFSRSEVSWASRETRVFTIHMAIECCVWFRRKTLKYSQKKKITVQHLNIDPRTTSREPASWINAPPFVK